MPSSFANSLTSNHYSIWQWIIIISDLFVPLKVWEIHSRFLIQKSQKRKERKVVNACGIRKSIKGGRAQRSTKTSIDLQLNTYIQREIERSPWLIEMMLRQTNNRMAMSRSRWTITSSSTSTSSWPAVTPTALVVIGECPSIGIKRINIGKQFKCWIGWFLPLTKCDRRRR